jgi:hypothetical protein
MKRITPEEVIAAYKETGAVPTKCRIRYVNPDGSVECCAMGALALQAGIPKDKAYKWCEETYGRTYSNDFQSGFDSNSIPYRKSPGCLDGYAVGQALIQNNILGSCG